MAYDSAQARQELLDEVASATDDLAAALAALAGAFEALDDYNAKRLEEELFRPSRSPRPRSDDSEFAGRHGPPTRKFDLRARRPSQA